MDCIVHGVTKSWTRLIDFHVHKVRAENVGIHLKARKTNQFKKVQKTCMRHFTREDIQDTHG